MFTQQYDGRQGLFGRDVSRTGDDHIGLSALIVTSPIPDAYAFAAMQYRRFHIKELQVLLFVADDDIDVVGALQTMICNRQQTVHIGRKVDARDFGALVDDDIQEARILMRESVVVLTPNCGGDEQIQ